MTLKYTNNTKVPIAMAVWLAADTYDKSEAGLSVTTLMKPVRQIILAGRVPPGEGIPDVVNLLASRVGTAVHDSVESAWKNHYRSAMEGLGYPKGLIDRVRINPDPDNLAEDDVPVYLELRAKKDVLGITVSGKFDIVIEGCVEDIKNTSTYSITSGNKDSDYILQGSLYRWLNPKIIFGDLLKINFRFTDWQKSRAQSDANYPQSPLLSKAYKLMPVAEAERFATEKVRLILKHQDTPEELLPLCTDEELWRSEPQYKYYKDPAKRARSTKNYDNLADANAHFYKDGQVGVVVTVSGRVRACEYCPGFIMCTQKDRLLASGDLIL